MTRNLRSTRNHRSAGETSDALFLSYQALRKRVLERDSQFCGSQKDLHVHHLQARGRLGEDSLHNLITLCVGCHRCQHTGSSL